MYKITFTMKSPMAFIEVPTFDGILSFCHVKEKLGDDFYLSNNDVDFSLYEDMPLKLHERGYYIASWLMFETEVLATEFYTKSWHEEHEHLADFGKKKAKVDLQRGEFKSYQNKLQTHQVDECWFYFESADVSRVEYLLRRHLVGIGKKVSQGFGMFSDFRIEEIDFDPFTETIRPIPISAEEMKAGEKSVYLGWKPPYWKAECQGFCRG